MTIGDMIFAIEHNPYVEFEADEIGFASDYEADAIHPDLPSYMVVIPIVIHDDERGFSWHSPEMENLNDMLFECERIQDCDYFGNWYIFNKFAVKVESASWCD